MNSTPNHLDSARSIGTSADTLRELASSPDADVRLAVAGNPVAELDVLASLLPRRIKTRTDQELALAIAVHPRSDAALLADLLETLGPALETIDDDQPAYVAGLTLCGDPRVPLLAIESLLSLSDTPRDFRKAVARDTRRPDVLELLTADRSGKVRKWALTRLAETT